MERNDIEDNSNGSTGVTEMSVKIEYYDIEDQKAEDVAPTGFENISKTSDTVDIDTIYQKLGNPTDTYNVLLDGTSSSIQQEILPVGLWSKTQSRSDKTFATSPYIIVTLSEILTFSTLTLQFDIQNNIYATSVTITYYDKNGNSLSAKNFSPDNTVYICSQYVQDCHKIKIEFNSLNISGNRLRLQSIKIGSVHIFESNNIKTASISDSISLISTTVPIGTFSTTFVGQQIDDWRGTGKKIIPYFDNLKQGEYFVEKVEKLSDLSYSVTARDYISLLDNATFYGGVYTGKDTVGTLVLLICNTASVPVVVDTSLYGIAFFGYIPVCSCREALQQVLFSVGAIALPFYDGGVIIKFPATNKTQDINETRIKQNPKLETANNLRSVTITVHDYKIISNSEVVTLYEKDGGTGSDEVTVIFDEPCYMLAITNGTILQNNSNFAKIRANAGCVLQGHKYHHSTYEIKKTNPAANKYISYDVSISKAYCVNFRNANETLNRVYSYYEKNDVLSAGIIIGKHDNGTKDKDVGMGDVLGITLGMYQQNMAVEEQNYSLNGGILVKECKLKQV